MADDPTVVDLVLRARAGDGSAWNDLVERYAPLVWSICRRYLLVAADVDDVGQSVWLRLVEHLAVIREPAALPGWLATTTRRECLRVLRGKERERFQAVAEAESAAVQIAPSAEDPVLQAERNATIRAAFAQLPPGCQQLLSLLVHDPPVPYAEISARLGTSVGGLGPRRGRCLAKLRRYPPLAALIESETEMAEGGRPS
jgi:RNA polymerase sigma factor (sigma-70 family)